jgi:proteasome assembly chaperone (PAC2) family protein
VEHLRWGDVPQLNAPVLITAFAGWNDAAQAATSAVRYLRDAWEAPFCAEVNPEEFINFAEQRPQIAITDGLLREITWPANECFYSRREGAEHDFVLLLGVEPNLRWRLFSDTVLEMIRRLDVSMVITLGGLLADVPHTRPVRVTGSASNVRAVERLEGLTLSTSRYEGPTGIVGILHDVFRREGIPAASIWANVPHYISAAANPKATVALLDRLDGLFSLALDLGELRGAAERFEAEVSEAVAGDADAAAYVRGLEERADAEEPAPETPPSHPLPSGEVVIRELEEFLRRQRREE